MKNILIVAIVSLLFWLVWNFFQSPESYLKKKTQYLIAMVSNKQMASDIALLSQISKIAKYIHFDVHLQAEYEGQVYTTNSLNELRSLLFSYFKYDTNGKMDYKNLTVNLEQNKIEAVVIADVYVVSKKMKATCKAILNWIKEKKWYVKKIKIYSCVQT